MEESILTSISFESLELDPRLLKGVSAAGFTHCTPIQAEALPTALASKDVAGQARTGTGKTAAFLLAGMHRLLSRAGNVAQGAAGQPRFVVLAPTRELAVQIEKDATSLGCFSGLRFGVVYGGTGYESQREMLSRGIDVLIGTPGRLIDYFKQRIFSLEHVEVVVLDEADRMFDLGFIRDIRYLLRRMPPPAERLNMLFSATLSLRVQELAYEHMNAPTLIDVTADKVTVDEVSQVLYHVASEDKIPLLFALLGGMDVTRTLIFVNTKRMGEKLDAYLRANGFDCGVLSGDVPQKQRLSLLGRFTAGKLPVLVATDVAARGLHIPDVSHVFNFDMPQDPEDYVHRVGRTARGGRSGDAVSLACEAFVYSLPEIEAYIGQRIAVGQISDHVLKEPKKPDRMPRSRVRPPGADRSPHRGRGRRRTSRVSPQPG